MSVGRAPVAQATLLFALATMGGVCAGTIEADTPTSRELEVIVVTARRRDEPLLDVPVSISVFGEAQLAQRQLVDLGALQYAAPNLSLTTSQTNRGSAAIAMRGQFEIDAAPTVDGAVGVFLDGVYLARITGANLDLVDMERVEVLRGPQGTLFGRNTVGGALNLITNRPSPRDEGYVGLGAGNYARRELEAMLNLPWSDGRYAARVVASHDSHDGYGRSTLTGKELDDDDSDFVRAQLRVAPTGHWNLDLAYDWSESRNAGQLVTLVSAHPPDFVVVDEAGRPVARLGDLVARDLRQVPANRTGWTHAIQRGASAQLRLPLARFSLLAISAWRELEFRAHDWDADGTPYDLGWFPSRRDWQEQWSQELQAQGATADEKLEWTAGLYGFTERATFRQRARMFQPGTLYSTETRPDGDVSNDSLAAYAQLGFAPSPRLRMHAGLRYVEDRRQLTSRNARAVDDRVFCRLSPALRDSPELCRATLPARRFDYLPWTVGVDYRPDQRTMWYAKLSRGHRAGGYNIRGAAEIDLDTFEPERVDVAEIGGRIELTDRRLRIGGAVFHTRFDNVQLVQQEGIVRYVQNGGAARISGGELELDALLGPMRLSAALGIADPEFTQIDPAVEGVTRDSSFLHTPDLTVSVGAGYTRATSLGELDLHADYAWLDGMPFSYDPDHPANQGSYGLLNARLALQWRDGPLAIEIWGRNLTDTSYINRSFSASTTTLFVGAALGEPRTYGVRAQYAFGARP